MGLNRCFPNYITNLIKTINRQHQFKPENTISCPNNPSYHAIQSIMNEQKGLMSADKITTLLDLTQMKTKTVQGLCFSHPEDNENHLEEMAELQFPLCL